MAASSRVVAAGHPDDGRVLATAPGAAFRRPEALAGLVCEEQLAGLSEINFAVLTCLSDYIDHSGSGLHRERRTFGSR